MRIIAALICALVIGIAAAGPLAAATPEAERTEALIERLKSLIGEAERTRAADPNFLRDLRDALDTYKIPVVTAVLSDDFTDGDYTQDPQWTVVEGAYTIDRSLGLRGAARATAAPAANPAVLARIKELEALREKRGPYINVPSTTISGRPMVRLAGELERLNALVPAESAASATSTRIAELEEIERSTGRYTLVTSTTLAGNVRVPVREELERLRAMEREEAGPKRNEILIARAIPNAFQIDLSLASGAQEGRFEVDVFQRTRRRAGYRLAYNGGRRPSFELIRFNRRGDRVIATYRQAYSLETGSHHRIQWSRDRDTVLTLTVDGQQLIRIADGGFRDPFDGMTIANEGGDYAVRAITVSGAAER